MTPSGFSIGTILKTNLFLKAADEESSLLTRKSMIPSIIYEALDSPGCTQPVNIIAGLSAMSSGDDEKLVIISISQSLPAKVLQRGALLTLSLLA